jgi:hypothetical protein
MMLKELNMPERLKSLIANNLLPNYKVTINYIKMAEFIFDTNLGSLKGKTTRGFPTHFEVHQSNPFL